jgi:tRNA threonylcarbamoyladenosine biosynthesis protein TsaB
MAVILALETATKLCSVAVGRDGVCLAERDLLSDKLSHAERVNVFVAEVMKEAGLAFKELDAVAVGIGPGSYTGLRIGLSAAKGLCYALDRPIIGISTLAILVQAALSKHGPIADTLWAMIDARRMEVFTQPFTNEGAAIEEVSPVILDASGPWMENPGVVFGDGADKAAELWSQAERPTHLHGIVPAARYLLPLAEERFANARFDDLAYLVPAYGKEANVTQPRRRGTPSP